MCPNTFLVVYYEIHMTLKNKTIFNENIQKFSQKFGVIRCKLLVMESRVERRGFEGVQR